MLVDSSKILSYSQFHFTKDDLVLLKSLYEKKLLIMSMLCPKCLKKFTFAEWELSTDFMYDNVFPMWDFLFKRFMLDSSDKPNEHPEYESILHGTMLCPSCDKIVHVIDQKLSIVICKDSLSLLDEYFLSLIKNPSVLKMIR